MSDFREFQLQLDQSFLSDSVNVVGAFLGFDSSLVLNVVYLAGMQCAEFLKIVRVQ
jgi:hypothetical protein